jgi:hypothetical protein
MVMVLLIFSYKQHAHTHLCGYCPLQHCCHAPHTPLPPHHSTTAAPPLLVHKVQQTGHKAVQNNCLLFVCLWPLHILYTCSPLLQPTETSPFWNFLSRPDVGGSTTSTTVGEKWFYIILVGLFLWFLFTF